MATKRYVITQPYYRKGRYYEPGAVVEIPADEKPSRTWKPYEEPKSAPAAPPSQPKGSRRPSDSDPI